MIICVVGPTGVGKTRLSVMLAKHYNGIIINADATQIYKELNIGSAKVTEEEKEGVEHFLFDIKNVPDLYSVADYQKDLRNLLDKYVNRNIILVGGTGLYLKAGLFDYQFSPIEKHDYSNYTNDELYQMAKKYNKDIQIDVNNRRRLENYLNRLNKDIKKPTMLYDAIFIGLTTNRDNLYNIINKRVDKMFNDGLVNEVASLYQKYGKTNILTRAIGYKEIILYLDKEITLDDSKELIKKNTRHYAKRQYTWFNNQLNVKWFDVNFQDFNLTYEEVLKYLEDDKKQLTNK